VKFRLAFLLEQTLGHVAHTKNIERALSSHPWVEPTVIKLPFDARPRPTAWVPGGRNWSVRASLMARRGLAQRLRQGALDAVFVHTQVAALLSTGLFARVPTVISLDATPRDFDEVGFAYGHRRQARWLEELKAALNRRALAGATALVTWSRQAARSLSEHYGVDPDRITVIRPGVDLGLFRPGGPWPRGDRFRVLFVGGDFRRKGGYDLLQAMRLLPATAELDVVTGTTVTGVPPGVTVRVHTGLGPGDPGLLELYRRADVFALPTLGDCFPQVLAEAAASGLPIIATNSGAIGEIVRRGANGLLVPAADAGELAAALRLLMDNARVRHSMGQESLRIAREEHDAFRNNTRIFELMAECARARGSRLSAVSRAAG